MAPAANTQSYVYFGTSGAGPGTGFSRAVFDSATGALSAPTLIARASDPAFFIFSANGTRLYVCNSQTPGGVSAYAVDRANGALSLLNHKASAARGPSHLSLDHAEKYILDANYGGGYVDVFALLPDGSLGERTAHVEHTGSGPHPRQDKPYAHAIKVDPTNRFALAADLGADQVVIYKLEGTTGALSPHHPTAAKFAPGAGPRHLSWHPNGRFLFVVCELTSTVVALGWDAQAGSLREIQSIATLPPEFSGNNTSAEIAVHPGGRFLYVSNRGHDSLAVLAIDPVTGRLELVQRVSSAGKTPRYFGLDPEGRWLVVLNQDSNNAVVFSIDAGSGQLRQHGEPVAVPKPCGIAFLPCLTGTEKAPE